MDREEFVIAVHRLRSEGRSIRRIAADLDVPKGRVERALKGASVASSRTSPSKLDRPGPPNSPTGLFVGRGPELRVLIAALDDALIGRGRTVMLMGEPGIGKTRTAQELSAYSTQRGAHAFWGRCYEEQGMLPYWPWVQIIRSYGQRCEKAGQLSPEMGAGAAIIGELVPEVKELLPEVLPPIALNPQQARFRLFDSIATFLKRASQNRPLVLVLDDLHWADPSSLLLLEFLSQELTDSRVMAVGTYRDTEVTSQHPLGHTLGELARHPHFTRISLSGLSEDEVGNFVESRAGVAADHDLIQSVHHRTEGNPLFVSQVVQLLTQEGETGLARSSAIQGAIHQIPLGVQEVIRRRLARLSETCNQLLTVASVIGREFGLELLELLMGDPTTVGLAPSRQPSSVSLSSEDLLEAVEEALAARVIEEMPSASDRYQFTHVLMQNTLAQGSSAARRARLHSRIGHTLEGLYGPHAKNHAAELVYHFGEAKSVVGTEKLVHYLLQAGEQALAAYAWEDALAYFQRGLEAKEEPLSGTDPASDSQAAALLFGLGRAQLATLPRARRNEGLSGLERSFEYYLKAGDVARAVTVAEYPIPRSLRFIDRVERRLERGLSMVPPDSLSAGRLLPTYGLELGRYLGDYDQARESFQRALAIARREGDTCLEIQTLASYAQVDYFHLHLTEGLEASLRTIGLAKVIGDPYSELIGHLHALQTLIHLGDRQHAEEHAEAGLALAQQINSRSWLGNVLRCSVNLYRFLGQWDRARDLALRYIALEQETVPLLKELASLEYEVGEFGRARGYLKQMHAIMRQSQPAAGPEYADTSLVSHFASRITNSKDDLEIAEQAAQVVLSFPQVQPFWVEIVRTGFALKAVQTQDSALAQEQYLALSGLEGKMRGSYISADRLMGLLAHTMGNLDQAVAHFEDSLTFCRSEGWRPEFAWACYDYASCLFSGNKIEKHSKAAAFLDESLALSTELGMRPLMEKATALQEKLEAYQGQTSRHPSNMTERQWEVLVLLAQGKTNREIAQELTLSERTVQRHIADIYDKIGARNRSEATSFTMGHLHSTD